MLSVEQQAALLHHYHAVAHSHNVHQNNPTQRPAFSGLAAAAPPTPPTAATALPPTSKPLVIPAAVEADVTVPAQFKCPITMGVMSDPVCAADGHTYERRAIEEWLSKKATSPMTGGPLTTKAVVPNFTLRSMIGEWIEQHK